MTNANWIDPIAPRHVRGLDVYQPGKPVEELERELGITGAIKVASNENPLGPSPRAMAAVQAAVGSLHLYPDAGGFALRRALSARLGVGIDHIALGAGSNELLYQMVIAFCDPDDEVLTHQFAFLSYRLAGWAMAAAELAACRMGTAMPSASTAATASSKRSSWRAVKGSAGSSATAQCVQMASRLSAPSAATMRASPTRSAGAAPTRCMPVSTFRCTGTGARPAGATVPSARISSGV